MPLVYSTVFLVVALPSKALQVLPGHIRRKVDMRVKVLLSSTMAVLRKAFLAEDTKIRTLVPAQALKLKGRVWSWGKALQVVLVAHPWVVKAASKVNHTIRRTVAKAQ